MMMMIRIHFNGTAGNLEFPGHRVFYEGDWVIEAFDAWKAKNRTSAK
jgi:hypothetical protein